MTKIDPSIVFDVDNEGETERLASLPRKPCKLVNLTSGGCFIVHSSGVVASFSSAFWVPKFKKWVDLVIISIGKENCKKIEWPGYMTFTNKNSLLSEESDPEEDIKFDEDIKFEEDQFDFEVNYDLDFPGKELLGPVLLMNLMKCDDIISG